VLDNRTREMQTRGTTWGNGQDIIKSLGLGFALRLALMGYAEWLDRSDSVVKFTDIDYHVFTDAARFVQRGESPYLRATYRYTPLLAWLLVPNITWNRNWGKMLFVTCDLIAGYLMYRILLERGLGSRRASQFASIWILNPFVAVISTRGSSEAVLGVLVVGTLYLLLLGRVLLGGIVFGLSVHFKIYPVIYALPFVLLLDSKGKDRMERKGSWRRMVEFVNRNRVVFTLASAGTFLGFNGVMYSIYGRQFLQETYLYHLVRKDHRHNFSPYFYDIYLGYHRSSHGLPFLLQFVVIWSIGWAFWQDTAFACFAQTVAFVTFNKVCTSQYFMWYLCFLPLILPFSRLEWRRGIWMMALWTLGQAVWLVNAFLLEHTGWNTFFATWTSSILFFFINCWVLVQFIRHQSVSKWFNLPDKNAKRL
jgi:phosphatidylinositol glycan class M